MRRFFRLSPWLFALQGSFVLYEHYQQLTAAEREALWRLFRSSKGIPARLQPAERDELTRIVRRLHLISAGRKIAVGRWGKGKGK